MAFLGDLFGRWFKTKRRVRRAVDLSEGARIQRMRRGVFRDSMLGPREPEQQAFPRFRASAMDRPQAEGEHSELVHARLLLRDVFTPAQPVTERTRFAGRMGVLAKLIEIIEDQRSHVVIYGERGIGKTSLVHILADVARESRYHVIYASAGAQSRFDEIFRAILTEIPQLFLKSVSPTAPEAEGGATLADRLPAGPFDARELGDLCAQITGTRIIIVLDEYDRIQDPEFRQSVAELIKNLSDRAARVQLILAGVASNLQELIGYIPSIRRNVIGLPMPRLTTGEVKSLIRIGENAAGVRFDDQTIEMIDLLSNGSPYLARLLSHHSSMRALDAGRLSIELADIWTALDKIVEEAESRIARRTAEQVRQLFEAERRPALGAAARAASTPDGWFTVGDVLRHLPHGAADECDNELHQLTNGGILERDVEGETARYRFRDEALPTYLWMLIARDHFRAGGHASGAMFKRPDEQRSAAAR